MSGEETTGRWSRWFGAIAEQLGNIGFWPLTLFIWLSSVGMCFFLLGMPVDSIHGTMNIVENWGAIERVALWQDWLAPIVPHYELPKGLIVWGFRASMLLGFLAQIGAFVVIMRQSSPKPWLWLLGPVGAHLIQFVFMIPSNSDVFFYEGVGDFVVKGMNPYVHFMSDLPNSPLLPFIFWVDIGTVYGPQWVNYNAALMWISGNDPVIATLWQKAFSGLAALGVAVAIFFFARRLSGGNQKLALACAALVAWQPNMILESTGQVHNDPHTVLIATLGLMLVIWGGLSALRSGIILVAFSVMVKFVTLPLLGVLGILRLVDRKKPNWIRRIFGNWILDGIAILSVIVLSFLPYWDGTHTLEEMIREPSRLYTNPVWRTINGIIRSVFGGHVSWRFSEISRDILQFTSSALFVGIVVWLGYKIWNDTHVSVDPGEDDLLPERIPWWSGHVLYAWMGILLVISFLPVNSHPWYWVWPVPAVAQVIAWEFRGERQWSVKATPTWVWAYLWFTALMTLAYHTRIARY
ncbi:MAG: hypothetical protein M9934_06030 [Thermomicrobiales bacterium]|nr:hypothetical protein [Thermomicrobiales bacterium]MCO5227828.1 hypothetical protein [Thermomicrobiales bacterium]